MALAHNGLARALIRVPTFPAATISGVEFSGIYEAREQLCCGWKLELRGEVASFFGDRPLKALLCWWKEIRRRARRAVAAR